MHRQAEKVSITAELSNTQRVEEDSSSAPKQQAGWLGTAEERLHLPLIIYLSLQSLRHISHPN